jgi:hypothetical protein
VQIIASYGILYNVFFLGQAVPIFSVLVTIFGAGSMTTLLALGFDGQPISMGAFHGGIIASVFTAIRWFFSAPLVSCLVFAFAYNAGLNSVERLARRSHLD